MATIRKYPRKSSPVAREAAKTRLLAVNQRLSEIKEASLDTMKWILPLMEAARFVVDVSGDPPSIEQLATALVVAEDQCNMADELKELKNQQGRLQCEATYYQYNVGHEGTICFHVHSQCDTKREADEQARSYS